MREIPLDVLGPLVKAEQCPFCGENPKLYDEGYHTRFFIKCPNCNSSSGTYTNARMAVDKWNMRYGNEQLQSKI